VGPLLALILGDGKQLVTQVVPQALLEFSRGCMRSIFSSLIQKPVYTFQVRIRGHCCQTNRAAVKDAHVDVSCFCCASAVL
jgi:hypothetical protein